MKQDIVIFKRIEKKYLLTPEKFKAVMDAIGDDLQADFYGQSTISSLYLDTPDFRMIRDSIDVSRYHDTPYKEKIRLRAYGNATPETRVFLELKKKYEGIVYKRRLSMSEAEAMDYITKGILPADSQILREIDYTMNVYGRPQPMFDIICEREAFDYKPDTDLRITFDSNLRYRMADVDLCKGIEGRPMLPDGYVIMELKTAGSLPLKLSETLAELQVFPSPFSKVGTAYGIYLREKIGIQNKNA